MTTAAERIYETSVDRLAEQQARDNRLTNAVAPVAATATAGAVLLEPATQGIAHAQLPQAAGFGVGLFGMLIVVVFAARLVHGRDIAGPSPRMLYLAAKEGAVLAPSESFHIRAAVRLEKVWRSNKREIKRLQVLFTTIVIGLLLELVGLGVASLTRPSQTHKAAGAPAPASLHLIGGFLDAHELRMTGALAQGAEGRVRIALSLLGRTGAAMALHPSIHDGRFKLLVRAPRSLVPLRSATYTINWAGSSSVAGAELGGTLARCPGDCQ